MPGDSVGALFEEICARAVLGSAEDEMDLREALGGAGCLVDVVAAKVTGVVDDFLDWARGEVLIAEGYCGSLVLL